MKKFKFNKELDGRWFVELPDWTGSKADLEMVAGADTMLEYMAEGNDHVYLYIGKEPFQGADYLKFERLADEFNNGAYYRMKTYRGIELNLQVWLCDVTLFVLNEFPSKIYIATA